MNISEFKSNFNGGVRANLYKMEISGVPEKLRFLCKAAQIPGRTINPVEVPYLNMKPKFAGDSVVEPLSLTIMVDTDFSVRNELEKWMEQIRNSDAVYGDEPGVYERVGNLVILGQSGDELATYEFVDIWPTNLSPVEMSFESTDTIAEFTCEFEYQHWNRLS